MATKDKTETYINRLLDDRELQRDLGELMTALRVSYGRAEKKRKNPSRLAGDKKFKRNAQKAGEAMRDVSQRFQGKAPKRHRLRKMLVFVLVAAGLAFAAKTLLDDGSSPLT